MARLTLSLPDDELARLKRWAAYDNVPVAEMVEAWMGWRAPKLRAGSMSVTCVIPESELKRWDAEARRRGEVVADWVRRMGNFVIDTGLASGLAEPVGRVALKALVSRCHWCETDLPGQATIRRRYCSDRCRVTAWRARRRHLDRAS